MLNYSVAIGSRLKRRRLTAENVSNGCDTERLHATWSPRSNYLLHRPYSVNHLRCFTRICAMTRSSTATDFSRRRFALRLRGVLYLLNHGATGVD